MRIESEKVYNLFDMSEEEYDTIAYMADFCCEHMNKTDKHYLAIQNLAERMSLAA